MFVLLFCDDVRRKKIIKEVDKKKQNEKQTDRLATQNDRKGSNKDQR